MSSVLPMTGKKGLLASFTRATEELGEALEGRREKRRKTGDSPSAVERCIGEWAKGCNEMREYFLGALTEGNEYAVLRFSAGYYKASQYFALLASPERGIATGRRANVSFGLLGRDCLLSMDSWIKGVMQMHGMVSEKVEENNREMESTISEAESVLSGIVKHLTATLPVSPAENPKDLIRLAATHFAEYCAAKGPYQTILDAKSDNLYAAAGDLAISPPSEAFVELGKIHSKKFSKAFKETPEEWAGSSQAGRKVEKMQSLSESYHSLLNWCDARLHRNLLRSEKGPPDALLLESAQVGQSRKQ